MIITNSRVICVLMAGLLAACAAEQRPGEQAQGKERLGDVRFEVSCSADSQQKFGRAMALYHSFDWGRGRAAFIEIAQVDPRCGMAYWGLAMVAANNPFGWPVSLNLQQGTGAIQKAQAIGAGTQRERDYIEALALLYKDSAKTPHRQRAVAYEQAMGQLAVRYPEDMEARLLYALALSANHDLNDKTFARPLKAVDQLDPLFTSYPNHPGVAHYLIHSYDYPPLAQKGLPAAQSYSKIAPDAAHAQHMPSHIFTRVGYWRESIAANAGSMKAAKGAMASTTHARDYQTYAYLQLAEDSLAERVWADASTITAVKNVNLAVAFGYAAMPSRLALERGRWSEAVKLEIYSGVPAASWKRFPQAESVLAYARGIGAARAGDAAEARKQIERLNEMRSALAARKLGYWAEQSEIQAEIVTAWALRAEGRNDQALAQMRAAADHEDRTEKNVVTPGPILPGRELLGDMLMELGQPAQALKEYEASMVKEPGRFRALYGAALAAEGSGDRARAMVYYAKLADMCVQSEGSRPELARARQMIATR